MAEEGKKISFGFSKLSKPLLKQQISKPINPNIQYIECLDSKAIKVKGNDVNADIKKSDLVIPLSTSSPHSKNSKLRAIIGNGGSQSSTSSGTSTEIPNPGDDLESRAIRELLEDVKKSSQEKESRKDLILELPPSGTSDIDKESTLEDYDTVPVADYGLAMLRGMGWDAAKGMGKSEKIVAPVELRVRPRGMGLGVEMTQSPKQKNSPSSSVPSSQSSTTTIDDELKIVKGCFVQVTSGSKKDMYGQIEGFNEETGRFILKMALGDVSLSVNGYMVKAVTKDEYNQNARVLNASKYKEYKDKETRQEVNGSPHSPSEARSKHRHGGKRKERSRSPHRKR